MYKIYYVRYILILLCDKNNSIKFGSHIVKKQRVYWLCYKIFDYIINDISVRYCYHIIILKYIEYNIFYIFL